MIKLILGMALTIAFLVGCVPMAPVVKDVVAPPARAQTNQQKWEYFCATSLSGEEITQSFDRAGQEGWELVGGFSFGPNNTAAQWCFKRPL